MKVYVIMSNDFPAGVLASQEHADRTVADLNANEEKREHQGFRRIFWRVYPFTLDEFKP